MKLNQNRENFNLCELKHRLKDHILGIVSYLNINLVPYGTLLMGKCPIHKGDNDTAFHIQTSGPYKGKIHCYTGGCNKDGTDLLSLVMRVGKMTFPQAIKVCSDIVGGNLSASLDSPFSFICDPEKIDDGLPAQYSVGTASRIAVRKQLIIPSRYFIYQRRFDQSILDAYDVGDCWIKGSSMRGRVVFPVYDRNMLCVGAVGRKIDDKWVTKKWRNSKGFKSSQNLYGLWNYNRTGRAIVVEGQGDLLKLRQAGYADSLGMFKKSLSINQFKILKDLGVTEILAITDRDKAGDEGYESILRDGSGHFKISRFIPQSKDIGDMEVEKVRSLCL